MIALVVFTDGRDDCLTRILAAADEMLEGPVTERWIHDDTGDDLHRAWIEAQWPAYRQIGDGHRRGFAGAIRHVWLTINRTSRARFLFHLEDDFVIRRPVDLAAMVTVLDRHPHLAQLALRRQPWNDAERAVGGVVEQHPDAYVERHEDGASWLEHRLFMTTNPSLYRRSLLELGWPDVPQSEGIFTHQLLRDPDLRFGFWGARASGEWVKHIGTVRAGVGY